MYLSELFFSSLMQMQPAVSRESTLLGMFCPIGHSEFWPKTLLLTCHWNVFCTSDQALISQEIKHIFGLPEVSFFGFASTKIEAN